MSLRFYLLGLAASSALSVVAFSLTIVNTTPYQGVSALLSFYLSAFFGTLGILTLAGYGARRALGGNEIVYAHARTAFRQAALASSVLAVLAYLQSLRLLSLWDAALIIMVATLVELYLRANAKTTF